MRPAACQAEINPLYEKMRSRFCQNGTVAEQLLARTKGAKKKKFYHHDSADIMMHANSLPREKAPECKRSFFSLRNVNAACMLLLIAGTVLFSGAALGASRSDMGDFPSLLSDSRFKDNMILSDAMPWDEATTNDICNELSFFI